jgi:hypothetical protein
MENTAILWSIRSPYNTESTEEYQCPERDSNPWSYTVDTLYRVDTGIGSVYWNCT